LKSYTKDGVTTQFEYEMQGLRLSKTQNGNKTRYAYNNAGQVITEANASNQQVANYVWGPEKLLAKRDAVTNKKYYYLYNGHGDVVQMIDENGSIVNKYQYDEWGNILQQEEQVQNAFKYAGEIQDEETGLYYLRSRYYDPSVGRFISKDTYEGQLTNPLSLNLYVYVENNPLIHVDPSGHYAQAGSGGVGGATPSSSKWVKAGNIVYRGVDWYTMGALSDFVDANQTKPLSFEYFTSFGILFISVVPIAQTEAATLKLAPMVEREGVALIQKLGKWFKVSVRAEKKVVPELGQKLEYIFGNATGAKHNIDRSIAMERQLNSIGIFNNESGRKLVQENLINTFNDASSVAKTQENGRIVRESLLAGPNGMIKMESVWEGVKLITVQLFGGK